LPETYNYSLTIYQIINLPIVVLKKKFPSAIENRLLEYPKTFYFNNLKEFEFIVNNQKQDYFYTIKPLIYFNDFWDEYFCKTESENQNQNQNQNQNENQNIENTLS
jgi:hypothetical protein